MKNKIKYVIFTLIVVIMLCCVAVNVGAASEGTCGENLTYTLDDNGTLTISGTGDMINWQSNSPWFDSRYDIKSVVINEGVTSIGDSAFY